VRSLPTEAANEVSVRRRWVRSARIILALSLCASPAVAWAQAPTAPIRVEFDEAVRRAVERNPTIQQAATNIAVAEATLRQTRGSFLPLVFANLQHTTIDAARGFSGGVTQPQGQLAVVGDVSMPIFDTPRWALANQNRDQIDVANKQTADVRKQIAVATAQAYLAVIAAHRQIEVDERALEVARLHLDFARKRLEGGAGSRVNQQRAAQEVSSDEAQIEVSRLALVRAQEALGVLLAENSPVDAVAEPLFEIPTNITEADWMPARTDVRAQQSSIVAAERVLRDSHRYWMPVGTASFMPSYISPSGLFQPAGTWRFVVSFQQPIYEGGQYKAAKAIRSINVDQTRLLLNTIEIQARSEVRLAQESVNRLQRALTSAQQAATQAEEVLRITGAAYELGATTNIEVIDAQRSARDAETASRRAEDAVRLAKLDLLVALGRFPR
jgi:outer membrane protein TolC